MASNNEQDEITSRKILIIIIGCFLGLLLGYFFYVGLKYTKCETIFPPINTLGLSGIRVR